ncbi:MAG: hypothetical protein OQL16_04575 [Gammaproteobacteria bacterium]|nr:hypothetical protein [Gammaproteobacteria bacterium]
MKRHSSTYRSLLLLTLLSMLFMPLRAYTMSLDMNPVPDNNTTHTNCHDIDKPAMADSMDKADIAGSGCCCDDMSANSCHCMSSVALTTLTIDTGTPVIDAPPVAAFLAPDSLPPTSLLRPPRAIQQ